MRLFKRHDCALEGHSFREETRRGITDEYAETEKHFRAVAVRVTQKRRACRHCGEATPWETQGYGDGINSLSLPRDLMDKLRSTGFLAD